MRIRSTKPEFWRSRTVASVSWDARLVLKGLESYVDDNGVGKDDIALIIGDIFPRDHFANPRETVARVSEAITHLAEAGLLWRYEAGGVDLLYISNWDALQRVDKPQKGRLPRPDGTMDYKESVIRESVANVPEVVAPVTGEQGNRGTGEQDPPTPRGNLPDRDTRPPRGGREVAERWNALAVSATAGTILDRYEAWTGAHVTGTDRRKLADAIDQCAHAGHTQDQIEAGIKAWQESDSWSPTQIPSFVRKHATPRDGPATSKARGWAAIADQLQQEANDDYPA